MLTSSHPRWPHWLNFMTEKEAHLTGSCLTPLPQAWTEWFLGSRHCVSVEKRMAFTLLFPNNPFASQGTYCHAISPAARSLTLLSHTRATQSMLWPFSFLNLKTVRRNTHKSMKRIFRVINYKMDTQGASYSDTK